MTETVVLLFFMQYDVTEENQCGLSLYYTGALIAPWRAAFNWFQCADIINRKKKKLHLKQKIDHPDCGIKPEMVFLARIKAAELTYMLHRKKGVTFGAYIGELVT